MPTSEITVDSIEETMLNRFTPNQGSLITPHQASLFKIKEKMAADDVSEGKLTMNTEVVSGGLGGQSPVLSTAQPHNYLEVPSMQRYKTIEKDNYVTPFTRKGSMPQIISN